MDRGNQLKMPQLLRGERNKWSYSLLQRGRAVRCIDVNDWALEEVVVGIGNRYRTGTLLSGIRLFSRNETFGRDLLACPATPLDGGGTGQNRMALVHGGDDMHSGD